MNATLRNLIPTMAVVLAISACSRREAQEEAPAQQAPPPRLTGVPQWAESADGSRIRYRAYGRGEPVLVFIHGWAADSSYWDAQIDDFKVRYTVVTLDLAGHGESDATRTAWTMDSFGDDVVAVLEH